MSLLVLLATVGWGVFPLVAAEPLRIMSFNIRFGTAADGENHWNKRQTHVATTIADFKPDLVGTQETLQFQADFIHSQLPGYTYFGRSRMKTPNEHCGIFYRTARFTWLAGGHFWLSESPEVPESISWDSSLPRMASWVLLQDLENDVSPSILFVNTHFDHRGGEARLQSARLIRRRIDQLRTIADAPLVIVTGDFNTGVDSPPYAAFLKDNQHLVDTYRSRSAARELGEGTFNGFEGKSDGPRIDWILADPRLNCQAAEIVRRQFDSRYPSDHFPVTAVLALPQ